MTSRNELVRELVMDGLSERSAQTIATALSRVSASFYIDSSLWPTRAVFGGLYVPWVLDVATDPAIKVDDSDPTLLHLPAGIWAGFLQAAWTSGAATSANARLLVGSSAGDGPNAVVSASMGVRTCTASCFFFLDSPQTQRFALSASDANGAERFSAGAIDLVQVSGW